MTTINKTSCSQKIFDTPNKLSLKIEKSPSLLNVMNAAFFAFGFLGGYFIIDKAVSSMRNIPKPPTLHPIHLTSDDIPPNGTLTSLAILSFTGFLFYYFFFQEKKVESKKLEAPIPTYNKVILDELDTPPRNKVFSDVLNKLLSNKKKNKTFSLILSFNNKTFIVWSKEGELFLANSAGKPCNTNKKEYRKFKNANDLNGFFIDIILNNAPVEFFKYTFVKKSIDQLKDKGVGVSSPVETLLQRVGQE